jgi:hypothetical protein
MTQNDVILWLGRRPGCFEAPTDRGCWTLAWEAFSGIPDLQGSSFAFMLAVKDEGFNVRPTTLGGYILDHVK